jgi:DNA-binding beta-propeller fold protein YncE
VSKLSAALKVFVFFPPLLLLFGTIGIVACKSTVFVTVTATITTSATATASPAALAFVSNFNSGTISEFKRDTTTGKLTRVGVIPAGSTKGPKGMAITPNNGFLYAANFADGKIYEYSIGSDAILTSLGSVSDGPSSGPSWIAIHPQGTFLWVTNFSNGTISTWSIGPTGTLTLVQTIAGLAGPFGLAVNSEGKILYLADNKAGLIYTFTINSSTGALSQNGPPIQNLPSLNGSPGLMVIDPTGSYLYTDDIENGVLSLFIISQGQIGAIYPSNFSSNMPVGIGIASLPSATYVVTANQAAGNTWAFQILNFGVLSTPISSGNVSGPTGLAVDRQNAFMYTADQGDGTVGIFQFNIACPTVIQAVCQIGSIASEASPAPDGSAPFDVVLTD